MRSAANSHVKMAKVSRRVPDTTVQGSRSYHAKTKSACLHRHGAREKSGILNINTPIFLTPPQEQVQLNKLVEKKVGSPAILRFYFQKTTFSYSNTYKNRHAIWSTFWRWTAKKFKPCLSDAVWKRFQQKIGMFMFKNQNDGATLMPNCSNRQLQVGE